MVVTYCTAADVASYMGVTIDGSSKPTTTQVESMINMMEAEIDRRTGRSWLAAGRTKTNEVHDMNYVYNWGYGIRIPTLRTRHKTLDYASGDRVQFWTGNGWSDILTSGNGELDNTVTQDATNGWIFVRGFIWTGISSSRFRVTYRYGETPVPEDIKRCTILLVCRELLNTASLFWTALPMGENLIGLEKVSDLWSDQIDKIIYDYADIMVAV